ncbi:MAG: hypothetical protein JRG93_09545 [Deltaproteobacteria bacterium]|nr:hypothetical protein [Deltaproteobacteria bacterium]
MRLLPGESEVLWFRAGVANTVAQPDGTVLSFTADVRTTAGFQLLPMPTAMTEINTARRLNLRVEEDANPVGTEEELTYTIHFSNSSGDPIDQVELTFDVPDGASHVSGDRTLVWDLGRLDAEAGGIQEVTVTLDSAANLPLGSQLHAVTEIAAPELPHETRRAITQTPVSATPLLATIEVNPDPAARSQLTTVTVTVSNPGPNIETADVTVLLPQHINTIGTVNRGGGTCGSNCSAHDTLSWTGLNLAPGNTEVLSFRPTIANTVSQPDGTLIQYETVMRTVSEVPRWTADTIRVLTP